jgi:hypothetical protein
VGFLKEQRERKRRAAEARTAAWNRERELFDAEINRRLEKMPFDNGLLQVNVRNLRPGEEAEFRVGPWGCYPDSCSPSSPTSRLSCSPHADGPAHIYTTRPEREGLAAGHYGLWTSLGSWFIASPCMDADEFRRATPYEIRHPEPRGRRRRHYRAPTRRRFPAPAPGEWDDPIAADYELNDATVGSDECDDVTVGDYDDRYLCPCCGRAATSLVRLEARARGSLVEVCTDCHSRAIAGTDRCGAAIAAIPPVPQVGLTWAMDVVQVGRRFSLTEQ